MEDNEANYKKDIAEVEAEVIEELTKNYNEQKRLDDKELN